MTALVFNPANDDTFASTSADHTIKVRIGRASASVRSGLPRGTMSCGFSTLTNWSHSYCHTHRVCELQTGPLQLCFQCSVRGED